MLPMICNRQVGLCSSTPQYLTQGQDASVNYSEAPCWRRTELTQLTSCLWLPQWLPVSKRSLGDSRKKEKLACTRLWLGPNWCWPADHLLTKWFFLPSLVYIQHYGNMIMHSMVSIMRTHGLFYLLFSSCMLTELPYPFSCPIPLFFGQR